MAAAENKAILQRYAEEIFNQGNLAVIDEIIAPNVVSRTSGADIRNREGFRMDVSRHTARGVFGYRADGEGNENNGHYLLPPTCRADRADVGRLEPIGITATAWRQCQVAKGTGNGQSGELTITQNSAA